MAGMSVLRALFLLARAGLLGRTALALENLALRQQLAVLHRTTPRPELRRRDRLLWAWLSRLWVGWRAALVLVRPATVVRWHRQGFRLFWRWKSRAKPGRPPVDAEVRWLIRRMSAENPLGGAPRIRAELRLLGHAVAESTVARYMARGKGKPPSPPGVASCATTSAAWPPSTSSWCRRPPSACCTASSCCCTTAGAWCISA
jgi:hypothetical protein